jgi:hypothetical protein
MRDHWVVNHDPVARDVASTTSGQINAGCGAQQQFVSSGATGAPAEPLGHTDQVLQAGAFSETDERRLGSVISRGWPW